MICDVCKAKVNIYSSRFEGDKRICVCLDCLEKEKVSRIESELEDVKHPQDFKGWKKADMSEAFWIHLGRYKKKPNRKSLDVMHVALLWAYHDDHGLSNSFTHALKWCGIDLLAERMRKDLPETDKED